MLFINQYVEMESGATQVVKVQWLLKLTGLMPDTQQAWMQYHSTAKIYTKNKNPSYFFITKEWRDIFIPEDKHSPDCTHLLPPKQWVNQEKEVHFYTSTHNPGATSTYHLSSPLYEPNWSGNETPLLPATRISAQC